MADAAARTASVVAVGSATSTSKATPPTSSATRRPAAASRSSTATVAPRPARTRQVAAPIPAPPPVTIAAWPARSRAGSLTRRGSNVRGADRIPEMTDDPLRRTGAATARRSPARRHALQHHRELEAGEGGAEAEVRAVAERHVVVRRATDVEGARRRAERRPRPGSPTRRGRSSGSPAAIATPPELGVVDRGAQERGDRRRPTQHLLDRAREQVGVVGQPLQLVRVLRQRDEGPRDRVAGRLVARDEELDQEHPELTVGERLPVLLVGGEHRHDVVRGGRPAGRRRARAARRSSR